MSREKDGFLICPVCSENRFTDKIGRIEKDVYTISVVSGECVEECTNTVEDAEGICCLNCGIQVDYVQDENNLWYIVEIKEQAK
jgi:hypothetical protein